MTAPNFPINGKVFGSFDDIPSNFFSRPCTKPVVISPTDNTLFPNGPAPGFFVGTGGNISFILNDGVTVVVVPVAAGFCNIAAAGINNTNTTASNIVAAYK